MRIALAGILLTGAWLGAGGSTFGQGVNGTAPTATGLSDRAQAASPAPGPRGQPAPMSNRPEDEHALRTLADAYARAYSAGDARALASFFTQDAELIDENGQRLRGSPMIETVFGAMFRQRPKAVLTVTPASIRFLAPDVAREEGRTDLKVGEDVPSIRHYTLLAVKEGNRWRYSSFRVEQEASLTPHQRLEELSWLVGDWLDESPDSVVHATCRWSNDSHFLLRDFTIQVQGKSVMTVTERIGWDPSTRQIKSWVFDSEGGHGSGLWSRAGNEWVIKSTGVLPDGRIATATHVLTRVGPQSARWSSVERTVGDRVVPDQAEYLMVRQPPRPRGR